MKKYRARIHIDGLDLPVDITLEHRRDTRFGITSKRISLRMPVGVHPDLIRGELAKLQHWVQEQFRHKPVLKAPFFGKNYQTGDVLKVGKRQYILDVTYADRSTHTAKLIGDTIAIQLSHKAEKHHQVKSIKTLLSRVVAADFFPEIARRVSDWNELSFRQPIKSINLKYNHSNWGSCSSHGNVNLSTRLLFAPDPVQDYVFLHELAHLVEMNHSERFWNLVARYMPDYLEKERWLKENRALCDF